MSSFKNFIKDKANRFKSKSSKIYHDVQQKGYEIKKKIKSTLKRGKSKGSEMFNKWRKFANDYALKHNISYPQAVKTKECSKQFHQKKHTL